MAAYRYGFNGMERDDEMKGIGNSYSTLWRVYDPRLARWFSMDPAMRKYASLSPYNFSFNSPILRNDPFVDDPEKKGEGRLRREERRADRFVNKEGGNWEKFKYTDSKERERYGVRNHKAFRHAQFEPVVDIEEKVFGGFGNAMSAVNLSPEFWSFGRDKPLTVFGWKAIRSEAEIDNRFNDKPVSGASFEVNASMRNELTGITSEISYTLDGNCETCADASVNYKNSVKHSTSSSLNPGVEFESSAKLSVRFNTEVLKDVDATAQLAMGNYFIEYNPSKKELSIGVSTSKGKGGNITIEQELNSKKLWE